MGNRQGKAIGFALLAAALYALSAPLSKLLLLSTGPAMMAAFLYLGAGAGMGAVGLFRRHSCRITGGRRYVVAMVVLDIAAPICLMAGLERTSAANAALLNNFEIVATAVIALFLFGEAISPRLWWAIALVTGSSMLLSMEGGGSFQFSTGSLLILLACLCWGLENNCTRKLSAGDPMAVVTVKGLGAGGGSLLVALLAGESLPTAGAAVGTAVLGFFAYGLSIFCYVRAQRDLGAARTGAWYAVAPFISVLLSLLIFREIPDVHFWAALPIMAAGAMLAVLDSQAAEKEPAEREENTAPAFVTKASFKG